MDERGQVFTLDMFFALVLTALILSYSGLALEQARRQAEGYALRYSLERTVNDAADVLVKTLGKPENWENDVTTLETPGLAGESGGNPVPNLLRVAKFAQLRDLCRYENWDTTRSETQAIMDLFGGSENFEIKVISAENNNKVLWDIWPGWDEESSSSVKNSLEVATTRRLLFKERTETVRDDVRGIRHIPADPAGRYYTLDFFIYSGELDLYDWYIYLEPSTKNQPSVDIWVNRTTGNKDYTFPPLPNDNLYPMWHHGTKYSDNALTEAENDGNPNNYIYIRVKGAKKYSVDVYIIFVPRCTLPEFVPDLSVAIPVTLEVKLWR